MEENVRGDSDGGDGVLVVLIFCCSPLPLSTRALVYSLTSQSPADLIHLISSRLVSSHLISRDLSHLTPSANNLSVSTHIRALRCKSTIRRSERVETSRECEADDSTLSTMFTARLPARWIHSKQDKAKTGRDIQVQPPIQGVFRRRVGGGGWVWHLRHRRHKKKKKENFCARSVTLPYFAPSIIVCGETHLSYTLLL